MTVADTNSSSILPDSSCFWFHYKCQGPVGQDTNVATWTQIYHRKITPNSNLVWQPKIVKAAFLWSASSSFHLQLLKKINYSSVFYAKTQ